MMMALLPAGQVRRRRGGRCGRSWTSPGSSAWTTRWSISAPPCTSRSEPINLCYDTFGAPAAMIRGLFEYLYTADGLTLVPHIPPGITRLEQHFPIRFGRKRLYLATAGTGPITAVTINGQPHESFDAKTVSLPYEATPDRAVIQIALGGAAAKPFEPKEPDLELPPLPPVDEIAGAELAGLRPRVERLWKFNAALVSENLADRYEAVARPDGGGSVHRLRPPPETPRRRHAQAVAQRHPRPPPSGATSRRPPDCARAWKRCSTATARATIPRRSGWRRFGRRASDQTPLTASGVRRLSPSTANHQPTSDRQGWSRVPNSSALRDRPESPHNKAADDRHNRHQPKERPKAELPKPRCSTKGVTNGRRVQTDEKQCAEDGRRPVFVGSSREAGHGVVARRNPDRDRKAVNDQKHDKGQRRVALGLGPDSR